MQRFNSLGAALALLLVVSGLWAQSGPSTSLADDKTIDAVIDALKKQAENGNGKAQFSLGTSYRDGFGVPQDFVESYFWLDLAASHITNDSGIDGNVRKVRDDVGSRLTNAVLLETQERAKQWFASHQPDAAATGATSTNRILTEKASGDCTVGGSDDSSRVASYTCACNKGNMDACVNLGFYYRMGWGVSSDISEARALYTKACDAGDGRGCEYLANSSPLSPQDSAKRTEVTHAATGVQAAAVTTPASASTLSKPSGGCAKNISFAVAEGGQIVPRVPKFTQKWIEKNQRKYTGLCFSQAPNPQSFNYLLVFSTSQSSFNGIFPTVVTSTNTNASPVSGSGTITSSSGSMWNYTYQGTETTTTTTTTQENLPYTDTTSTLYANAYGQNGSLISRRWRSITTRQGGEGANTLGYNLGAALAAIHIKERLLKDSVEDVAK